MKIEDIYKYQVSKFKCLNHTAAEQFHEWVNVNDGTTIKNLFVPSARTINYGLKQLKANGPRIWN